MLRAVTFVSFTVIAQLSLGNIITRSQEAFEQGKINIRCVSQNGSIYDLAISKDLGNENGEIRYQYMGQDVFYLTETIVAKENIIMGIAYFNESRTGEKRGRKWIFTFLPKEKAMKDNDSLIKNCK